MPTPTSPPTPDGATREDITFASGDDICAAWLYRPQASAPVPVIVMGHGLGSVREMRLDAVAERFVDAGYACLVFDYRHFGASTGEPRQVLDIGRQLADWDAALDYVRDHVDLDPTRIAVWGTSFGGGHVLEVAAANSDVRCVVSQCPFTDGLASSLTKSPLESGVLTVRALADLAASAVGRGPVYAPLAAAPGTAAMMSSPDALPGMLALQPTAGTSFRNEVCARFALQILRYFPGRRAKDIESPVLFCICEPDTVAPAKAAQRYAATAPRGEVRLYPDGHFDIYVGEPFERVIADQLAFLAVHLPANDTGTESR